MPRRVGFTLIELILVISIIAVLAALALPNLMAARRHANEAASVATLRTVAVAETAFRERNTEGDQNYDYGMLSELSNVQLIDSILGAGLKQGYVFEATYSFLSSDYLWFSIATPALVRETGDRYFSTNNAGVIFYTTGTSIALDTSSCLLPRTSLVPTGK
jgi:prepilin-type N-terminal cleavage/methylation domain-containing protein